MSETQIHWDADDGSPGLDADSGKREPSREPNGTTFEEKVAELYGLLGFEVTRKAELAGNPFYLLIEQKLGGLPIRAMVLCRDADIDADECSRILAQLNVARKIVTYCRWVVVCSQPFAPAGRGALEGRGVICLTYAELLHQLVPLDRYAEGIVRRYKDWVEENWGGQDRFIRPDVIADAGGGRLPALDGFKAWLDGESSFLVVLGDLGTGKTALLSFLAYEMACGLLQDPLTHPAPVLIPLREARKHVSLEGIIIDHFSRLGIESVSAPRFEHLLRNGKVVLLLDGFDEMAGGVGFKVACENFRELRRAADLGGKVLLSCRTHFFKDSLEQARLLGLEPTPSELEDERDQETGRHNDLKVVVLQPFNDAQVRTYLQKARPVSHEQDWEMIGSLYNFLGLTHHPLLLDMIVKTLPRLDPGQPINAAALYKGYTNIWMEREDGKPFTLHRDVKLRLMPELAWQMWERHESCVHGRELAPFVERLSDWDLVHLGDQEPEQVAREMQRATFLVRNGDSHFAFVHPSFQEFFLAVWILDRFRRNRESVGAVLDMHRLNRRVVYFLAQLDEKEELLAPLQRILQSPYRKRVSENCFQILYWGGRVRCGMEETIDDPVALRQVMATRLPWRANLQNADLAGMDLAGAVLPNALMSGADLTDACLNHATFHGADLRGALLVGARCRGASFTRCDLRKAKLERAEIDEADFSETAVWHADQGANSLRLASAENGFQGTPGRRFTPVIQMGEQAGVQCGSFSSDGKLLAYGSLDRVIRLWRMDNRRLLRTLEGHGEEVRTLSFSPDGMLLASGSDDSTVRLWDPATGNCIRVLAGHREEVFSLSFSPDGRLLASGSADHDVRLWETATGRTLSILEGHQAWVRSVAFTPDGAILASGSDDNTIRLWETATGETLRVLEGDGEQVRSLSFSPEGAILAGGYADNTVQLWQTDTGQRLRTLHGHWGEVRSVAFSPVGGLLASGSDDSTIRIWDPFTGKCFRTLYGHGRGVRAVWFSTDGSLLASGSDDNTVRIWRPTSGRCLRTLEDHRRGVRAVAFSPDGSLLAGGSGDHTVQLWEPAAGASLRLLQGHRGEVRTVAFSPDGKLLASGSDDDIVLLWNPARGVLVHILRGHRRGVQSVAFSPDGTLLASGSYDNTVRLWQPSRGRVLRVLEGHRGEVWSVAFAPDGKTLASASGDNTVKLWDPLTGENLRTLTGHRGWVRSVALSPDGTVLASGSGDNQVRLWDPSTGECFQILEGHQGEVWAVTFSPDGALLATGSSDNSVRLWDVKTSTRYGILFGHFGTVSSVAFAPGGKYLVAVGSAGRLQFWDYEEEVTFLYRYSFGPGAWLDLLPDGRFDASPQGMRHHCYTEQGTFDSYLAEKMVEEFHDPKGVRAVLSRYVDSTGLAAGPGSRLDHGNSQTTSIGP